jgi:hypothetical protein
MWGSLNAHLYDNGIDTERDELVEHDGITPCTIVAVCDPWERIAHRAKTEIALSSKIRYSARGPSALLSASLAMVGNNLAGNKY